MTAPTYRIEVKDGGAWVAAPGEATGWPLDAARAAVAAGIPTTNGDPANWDGVRLVNETDGTVKESTR